MFAVSIRPPRTKLASVPDIGTLIAHHRSGRRLLSSIAAEDVGLAPNELEAIESGEIVPSFPDLLRIASALKMSMSELFADPNTASVSREHSIELPYEEYMGIADGSQSVLVLRNSQGYRVGDVLRLCCGELAEFSVGVKGVHMCEMMKSIAFKVPPGFVIVELS